MNSKNMMGTMQTRIGHAGRSISRQMDHIGQSVQGIGRDSAGQMRHVARQAKSTLMPSGKTIIGLGALSRLVSRNGSGGSGKLSSRSMDRLAGRVEERLIDSERFQDVIAQTVRKEVRKATASRSGFGRLLNLGMLAAAAYGINHAVRRMTGQSVLDLVRSRSGMGQARIVVRPPRQSASPRASASASRERVTRRPDTAHSTAEPPGMPDTSMP